MHKNTLAFVIAAAVGGFICGFWLANSLNRSAGNSPAPQSTQTVGANSAATQPARDDDLTSEELDAKIAEADKNPSNFNFQKDLGIALYKYAATKQDVGLFTQAVRILERADSLKAGDFDVLVMLGNAYFDIGFFREDASSFQKARDVYAKALAVKPGDPDVSTDLGITFFLQKPPAYDKAAAQLIKVSESNPKHERSLQFLIQTYVKQNKFPEAEKALNKLRSINPGNQSLPDLTDQITGRKTA